MSQILIQSVLLDDERVDILIQENIFQKIAIKMS